LSRAGRVQAGGQPGGQLGGGCVRTDSGWANEQGRKECETKLLLPLLLPRRLSAPARRRRLAGGPGSPPGGECLPTQKTTTNYTLKLSVMERQGQRSGDDELVMSSQACCQIFS